MKNTIFISGIIAIALTSCTKNTTFSSLDNTVNPKDIISTASYINYTIKQGSQYCDQNTYTAISTNQLKFLVKFDSSAIYQTTNANNQADINKLLGFSDNNAEHHKYSARIGWRWKNNQLQLFGYTYNNGIVSFEFLSTIDINTENNCSIKVQENNYLFTVNSISVLMPRASTTLAGSGYKLYPYFGGNETAPHNIKIAIKEY